MSDLISRSGLMELARNHIGGTVDCNDIARFPAVDAVEVVRCKDCEEYIPWLYGWRICGRVGSYHGNTEPDDFCSRGRRKMSAEVE